MVLGRPKGSTTTTPAPVTTTTPAIKLPDPPPPIVPEKPMLRLGSYGNASIDRWDVDFINASDAVKHKKGVKVDPHFMKALMDVESGGDGTYPASRCRPRDGFDSVPACGPMQIKQRYHQQRCPECDFATVPGQIELATHIIGDTMKERGKDEYDALVTTYFPGDDVNGTTQGSYVGRVKNLVRVMYDGTTPVRGDVLDLLFGGNPYIISAQYGQLVTWSCPGCYDYYEAYGLDAQHHWAYDASARVGDGAPLYSPFDGYVVCAGTGVGRGAWGTGCAAFDHSNNYGGKSSGRGHGRLEIAHEDGDRTLILGHALSSRVGVGDTVKQGDLVGQQGGMNGSHVHVEGRYANGTKIGDPRKLFGGGAMPITYADPIPVPQTEAFDKWWTVTALHEGVPVYQRADTSSPLAFRPLTKGEEVEVVYFTLSHEDGSMYAITRNSRRVPVSGLDLSSIKEFSNG